MKKHKLWPILVSILFVIAIFVAIFVAISYRQNMQETDAIPAAKRHLIKTKPKQMNILLHFKFKNYHNSSTPVVFNLTNIKTGQNYFDYVTADNLDKNLELVKGDYELTVYPPLNSNQTAYDTSLSKIIYQTNDYQKTVNVSYPLIKKPDPDSLNDTLQDISQIQDTKAVSKMSEQNLDHILSQYRDLISKYNYLSHRQKQKILNNI